MDKYEYRVRVEEIENLIKEARYTEAAEIADTVDWKNVKEIVTLCEISDIYKACKRYEDSRDVLLLAYERNPSGRLILYSLCELSIKLGDIVNAIEYYKEFQQVAPKDPGRYVLKYKLFTTQGVGIDERIGVLEELQTLEIKEKWMYELAYLYHMAGYGEKCVEECNQIIVFYGDGKYVIKALELKEKHEPLTDEQLALYKRLTEPAEPNLVKDVDVSNYSTMDLQKEIADGLKKVLSGEEAPVEYEAVLEEDDSQTEAAEEPVAEAEPEVKYEAEPEQSYEVQPEQSYEVEPEAVNEVQPEPVPEVQPEIQPVQVSDVTSDMHEITASTLTEQEKAVPEETGREIIESVAAPEESSDGATRIFTMGDIIEIAKATQAVRPREERKEEHKEEPRPNVVYPKSYNFDEVKVNKGSGSSRFPNFDDMMSLEGDGQMSFVVPEQAMVDKQITGQISIEDVLREWEQVKNAGERKWEADVRKRVKDQTTDMFRDFDELSKTGPLEIIEGSFDDTVPIELTEEELSALRSSENPEFLNIDVVEPVLVSDEDEMPTESLRPEPVAEDSTTVLPSPKAIDDYLEQFAAACEEREPLADYPPETEPESEVKEAPEQEEATKEEVSEEEISEPEESVSKEETAEPEESASEEASEPDTSVSEQDGAESNETEKEKEGTKENVEHDGLSDEQCERYEAYIQKESGVKQLVEALSHISMESNTGNMIISSDDADSAVELARDFILELSARDQIAAGKAAKIKASTLNAKDAGSVLSSLYDCAVVIQDAHELRPETMDKIFKAISEPDRKMFIALTVNKRNKNKFIMEYGNLLSSFNVTYDIEALSNKELAEFAKKYAYSKEYSIDEMGLLALHTRIEERQTSTHCVMTNEVKEIVDAAIVHASKKSIGHFFGVLSGKIYDGNDMIVLREKDFNAI